MKKMKQASIFTLAMMPLVLISTYFVLQYQWSLYPQEIIDQMLAQAGSKSLLMIIGMVQTAVTLVIACFFGYILSGKLGLWRPIRLEREKLRMPLLISLGCGIVFSLDYWTFGAAYPAIREATAAGMTLYGVVSSILYGGIVEELMMRLFHLSLAAFLLWKIFARKQEQVPAWVLIAANVAAALLFAAGHLPATMGAFGELTPMLIFRCFFLNGGFGLVFGYLYCRYGLVYAMLSHAMCHIISKMIWLIFV